MNTDTEITHDAILTSESVEAIFSALVTAQGSISDVPMKGSNSHFRSKYATLEDVLKVCRPILTENGLGIVTGPSSENGTFGASVRLIHKSGQWIQVGGSAKATRGGAQELGSILTYLRRYTVCSLLNIAGDTDDDAEAAEGRGRNKTPKSAPPTHSVSDEEYAQMGNVLAEAMGAPPEEVDEERLALRDHYSGALDKEFIRPDGKKITEKQRKRMYAITKECEAKGGLTFDLVKTHLQSAYGLETSKDVTMNIYDELIEWIQNCAGQQ